jgi:hypothetical protein
MGRVNLAGGGDGVGAAQAEVTVATTFALPATNQLSVPRGERWAASLGEGKKCVCVGGDRFWQAAPHTKHGMLSSTPGSSCPTLAPGSSSPAQCQHNAKSKFTT